MKQHKDPTLSFDDWKREQLKNIKIRAAYNALAEEFARAEKKIKARKKKRTPACATSLNPCRHVAKASKGEWARVPDREFLLLIMQITGFLTTCVVVVLRR